MQMVYHYYNNRHYLLLILRESRMVRTIYLKFKMKYYLLPVIWCLFYVEKLQVAWPFKANLWYSNWWSKKVFYAPVSALWEHLILRGQLGMLLFKLQGGWPHSMKFHFGPCFPFIRGDIWFLAGIGVRWLTSIFSGLKNCFWQGLFWRRKTRFPEGKKHLAIPDTGYPGCTQRALSAHSVKNCLHI